MILLFDIFYHSWRSRKTFIRLCHFDLKTRFVFFHHVTYFKLSRYKNRNVFGHEVNFVIQLTKFVNPMIDPLTPFLNAIISLGVSRYDNHTFLCTLTFCILLV